MDGSDMEVVVLSPTSEEYKKIEKDFLQSSKHQDVSPVQVVQVWQKTILIRFCHRIVTLPMLMFISKRVDPQIRRIQSQPQWQRYCVLKQAVDKKYPKQKNERFLYHGTTKEICQKINRNGFNRSFCGRNGMS